MAQEFYSAALTAGSILAGFTGTFLSFRIQREANYFRDGQQQHFTVSFLLLVLGAVCTVIFGVVLPLFAIANPSRAVSHATITAGVAAALIIVAFYFVAELVHYEVLKKLDDSGWRQEWWIVPVALTLA